MKVLLDTSFLMLMAELGKNLLEVAEEALGDKIEAYVLEESVKELRALAGRGGRKAMNARAALKIAERVRLLSFPGRGKVDQRLMETAKSAGLVLATADSGLISEARRESVPILIVRKDLSVSLEGVAP